MAYPAFFKARSIVSATALVCSLSAVVSTGAFAQSSKAITEWDQQTNVTSSKVLRDAADRFEQQNPGYKVEDSHVLNESYKTKLKVAFGANQPPCVFENWGGGGLHEYVKSGQIVDLTPYLNKDPAYRGRFMQSSWNVVTFNGKTYGVAAENAAAAVIFYNKEVFKKYGITPPKTWDELMHVVAVLKSHDVAAFSLANKNKWTGSMYYMYLVDRIGGPQVMKDAVEGKGKGFEDPAFIEAGKRVQELVKAGAFAPGINGLDYDSGASRRLLYSGKAAMELMGAWEASTIANEAPAFSKDLDFFPFPSVPGGKGDPRDLIGTVGDGFLSISTECKTPDAAFKLIQALTDDQAMQDRVSDHKVPPVNKVKIDDPFLQRLQTMLAAAPSVQLWYDQVLPPALGELHKDTTQQLFGLSVTPEAAAQQMEAAFKKGS
ncbi:extracellular solute-binding protein [Paraburkholderia sp. BL10I2N1]|uniref:extracellular solute-binding protein n=1 Tax=Paraburkholderia sp. BL10I2N1 TaxID=1938796 RepID=UPI00105BFD23|nr:extracellular solute-binding protein [Paraburkholderia sp. BL10I2N1]TDN57971.1 carbohydrate ABC transporter substrate-binding protein (CUT1 family) [Paraburkholderia sp. BL10I2N1]